MMKVILEGVVGSTAYGLATEDSDIDMMGVFLAPTTSILGIKKVKESIVTTNPDRAYHELGKFIRLAMQANPTILEFLYLPEYTVLTEEGKLLVENRDAFLSKKVFFAFGGYAYSQAKKLEKRGDSFGSKTKKRYHKHARHCFRLLQEGRQLLETGTMDIRVKNRDEIFKIGELPPDELITRFTEEYKKFKEIKTILPDEPDYNRINNILLKIRINNLAKELNRNDLQIGG
jgi:predicted nucleotidyltransferase